MNTLIRQDLYRIYPQKPSILLLFKGIMHPGFAYMFFLRHLAKTKRNRVWWVFLRLVHRHLSYKFGFQIPPTTKIGPGFYIGHFGNVIISPEAEFGSNCNIGPGVTVGKIGIGAKKGSPKVGDFVWMGTNCILVGNIQIGSNVLIAPGAYVNFDVPGNSLVIGNPGKIIRKENPTAGYINNVLTGGLCD